MKSQLRYQIALTQLKHIGPVQAKYLLTQLGSVEHIFDAQYKELLAIDGIGRQRALQIMEGRDRALQRADEEIAFLNTKSDIQTIFITDKQYPNRLKFCEDGPILLYSKGNMRLNHSHILAIVGTRNCTHYGLKLIKDLCFGLQQLDVILVSGLAYGVDTTVHEYALEFGMETIAVLAHSLDRIYPAVNRNLSRKMCQKGGLLSEYASGMIPNKENFPMRNRIVAGLCDATVIIESGRKGGSLITAQLANSYNRDVFAFPGNIGQSQSEGCNDLIKKQEALLIENAEDICHHLGWLPQEGKIKNRQRQLFLELTENEHIVVQALQSESLTASQIAMKSQLPLRIVHTVLLNLELNGVIRIAPGNRFALI